MLEPLQVGQNALRPDERSTCLVDQADTCRRTFNGWPTTLLPSAQYHTGSYRQCDQVFALLDGPSMCSSTSNCLTRTDLCTPTFWKEDSMQTFDEIFNLQFGLRTAYKKLRNEDRQEAFQENLENGTLKIMKKLLVTILHVLP